MKSRFAWSRPLLGLLLFSCVFLARAHAEWIWIPPLTEQIWVSESTETIWVVEAVWVEGHYEEFFTESGDFQTVWVGGYWVYLEYWHTITTPGYFAIIEVPGYWEWRDGDGTP